MARSDGGSGSAVGGVEKKVEPSNLLGVDVNSDVRNVFSCFRDYPNRALYDFEIKMVLREKGGNITQGECFDDRVRNGLYILQRGGLVKRERDGRYRLTSEGRQVDIERVDVANI